MNDESKERPDAKVRPSSDPEIDGKSAGDLEAAENHDGENVGALSRHLLLYTASGIIVLIVFCVSVLPRFVGGSEFLYNPGSLKILYATLSLAAAIITFGVIGDSGAIVRFNQRAGTLVQVSGSAAGFAIFYYLLSSGLNPYKYLDVYLYKNNGQIMRTSDGAFEVVVASHISQSSETSSGHATFPIPRSEKDIRLFVNGVSGQLWEVGSFSPQECVEDGGRILVSCDAIDVRLRKSSACLGDFRVASYEAKPISTTLEIVLDTLKENLQNLSVDLPVNLQFSDELLERGYHQIQFELERKNESSRSICEHMAAIENRFNWSRGKREIRAYLSCDTMLFSLVGENQQEGYEPCL